jgi:uncharacterized protein (DUF1330 family)
MAAYLIADIDIRDAEAFETYRREVPATEKPFRGRYHARGGEAKVLEGDWKPHRLVIIEFPDMDALMGRYNSPAYQPLIALRKRCAHSRLIAVEGISQEMAAALAAN